MLEGICNEFDACDKEMYRFLDSYERMMSFVRKIMNKISELSDKVKNDDLIIIDQCRGGKEKNEIMNSNNEKIKINGEDIEYSRERIGNIFIEFDACKDEFKRMKRQLDSFEIMFENDVVYKSGLRKIANELKSNILHSVMSKVDNIFVRQDKFESRIESITRHYDYAFRDIYDMDLAKIRDVEKCIDKIDKKYDIKLDSVGEEIKKLDEIILKLGKEIVINTCGIDKVRDIKHV